MHDTDELARRLVIRHARQDAKSLHLRACPDVVVVDQEAYDGGYGCETGCEYVRLEATISCPHGEAEDYDYGEFGDLADLIADMERDAASSE